MGVVAFSLIAIGTQSMTDGLSEATGNVVARNTTTAEPEQATAALDDAASPEQLNAIETAAGAVTFDPDDTFAGGFTDVAPKALADDEPAMPLAAPTENNQAN